MCKPQMRTVNKEVYRWILITTITAPLTSKNNLEANQFPHKGEAVDKDVLYQYPGSSMMKKPLYPSRLLGGTTSIASTLECLLPSRTGCLTQPHQSQPNTIHSQWNKRAATDRNVRSVLIAKELKQTCSSILKTTSIIHCHSSLSVQGCTD